MSEHSWICTLKQSLFHVKRGGGRFRHLLARLIALQEWKKLEASGHLKQDCPQTFFTGGGGVDCKETWSGSMSFTDSVFLVPQLSHWNAVKMRGIETHRCHVSSCSFMGRSQTSWPLFENPYRTPRPTESQTPSPPATK